MENSVEKVENIVGNWPSFSQIQWKTPWKKWISPSGSTKNGYNRSFWHSPTATTKPLVHREFLEWPVQTWYNKKYTQPRLTGANSTIMEASAYELAYQTGAEVWPHLHPEPHLDLGRRADLGLRRGAVRQSVYLTLPEPEPHRPAGGSALAGHHLCVRSVFGRRTAERGAGHLLHMVRRHGAGAVY